ncbi:unnamed protein product, partial [Sphagnum jensenii]
MSTPSAYSSKVTILSALMNMASVYSLHEHLVDRSRPYLIEGARIHFKNRRLFVSHLYEKDGSNYHPSFTNKDRFTPYTQFIADIRDYIDAYASGKMRNMTHADEVRYKDYVDIYQRMICANVRHLEISGMRHEVLADYHVVQDAFGAVLSSLENGFVLDGYLTLYRIVTTLMKEASSDADKRDVLYVLKMGVFDILSVIHSWHIFNKFEESRETNVYPES